MKAIHSGTSQASTHPIRIISAVEDECPGLVTFDVVCRCRYPLNNSFQDVLDSYALQHSIMLTCLLASHR